MNRNFHLRGSPPTGTSSGTPNKAHSIGVIRLPDPPEEHPPSGAARETRVLVVIDGGLDDRNLMNALRRAHGKILVSTPAEAIRQQDSSGKIDIVLLCSRRTGSQCTELVERLTAHDPLLPVIVVTGSTDVPARPESTERHQGGRKQLGVNAALLLQSMREALRGPKIKRLIRISGARGGARFVARNARWLSEDLQARYSTSPVHLPVQFGAPVPTHSLEP
ncbi:MAG TPA: hypothetical protein DCY13_21265 [Verrucomicrobiales bacterium]|nr:hypothetical protein [Verrucomicrobiales bacterium]